MHAVVGPKDGRLARRKRCNACFRRKIKCHGGIPCDYCKRTRQACNAPTKPKCKLVFVQETSIAESNSNAAANKSDRSMRRPTSRSLTINGNERYIHYFFTSFLAMNGLTGDRMAVATEILDIMKNASALRAAICTVASHNLTQQSTMVISEMDRTNIKVDCLQNYGQSVCYLQELIASNAFPGDPSALWTTLFLGLYEMMNDSTGTKWLSHFLNGTCAILRLQSPAIMTCPDLQSKRRRAFFLHSRIFEITRSLIYSSTTFLWEPEWKDAVSKLWKDESMDLWHPKESLFDMLPSFSELSIRALRFSMSAEQLSFDTQVSRAKSLANEGFVLQENLQNWRTDTLLWEAANRSHASDLGTHSRPDTELMISYAYYHAANIYLSGTYDYHKQWREPDAPRAPILSRGEVDRHVFEILRLSHVLLNHGVCGIFLFFPLRVAGARADSPSIRGDILDLFRVTAERGFIVAAALMSELSELWTGKDGASC